MNGLILIDKPAGCTSHDVVNKWRKLAGTKRAGHLGTLDPMATGLMVVVTGTATRLAQFYGKAAKTYVAEITFGMVSDTYDREGELVATGISTPPEDEIVRAMQKFRGKFWQTPPPVSAKKVNGVPAYKLARQKMAVELKPVEVDVTELEIRSLTTEKLTIHVTCSAGTYIRAIAHDLGQRLGCGAMLSCLRRTAAGAYALDKARSLEQLGELAASGRLAEAVVPVEQMLSELPAEHFDLIGETQIRQGRDFRTSPFVVPAGAPLVKALTRTGELIAIGELKIPNLYHPSTVL